MLLTKKIRNPFVIFIAIAAFVIAASNLSSCKKDTVEEETTPYILTQADLDKAIIINAVTDSAIIGNPFLHQSPPVQALFRDVFTNVPKSQITKKGTIYVIKAYPNVNGKRGTEVLSDIMIKREKGFNPLGLDFEYLRIVFDSTVDYKKHPNGMLPAANSASRGDGRNIVAGTFPSNNCISCHVRDDNFLFTN
jgi:hypothetical protein